jgi:hypothetical protein
MSLRAPFAVSATVLLLAACGGAGGGSGGASGQGSATMNPGQDCLGCHSSFTAAGTVYEDALSATSVLAGARVVISDGVNPDVVVTTNAAGNFYTSAALSFAHPANVSITVSHGVNARAMPASTLTRGGCAAVGCHTLTAFGRVHVAR